MQNTKSIKTDIFSIFVYAWVALIVMAPITTSPTISAVFDFLNHIAMIVQAKVAILQGQFPLRVAPLEHNGFLYPYYQFYAPTGYLITGLLHAWVTPSNALYAYQLSIGLMIILGGWYMNRLTYRFTHSQIAAFLAGVLYMTVPYNILLVNKMGALNEALAFNMLPIVVFYTVECYEQPIINSFLKMTLAWYFLATLHLLTFLTASVIIGITMFCQFMLDRRWQSLLMLLGAYVFAGLLACWYLAPLFAMSHYLQVGQTFASAQDFYSYSPSLSTLFMLSTNKMYAEHLWPVDGSTTVVSEILPAFGLPLVMAVGVTFYALIKKQKIGIACIDKLMLPMSIVFLAVALIMWSPINFWHWLPQSIRVIQYSWRLLNPLTWIGALMFAWALCILFQNKFDKRHAVCGTIALLLSAISFFPLTPSRAVSIEQLAKQTMLSYGQDSYLLNNKLVTSLLNASVLPVEQVKNHCQQKGAAKYCQLTLADTSQWVALPVLFYPNMLRIQVNGKSVTPQAVPYQHYLLAAIQPVAGKNNISIEFVGYQWANYISWIAWGIVGLALVYITIL